MRSLLPAIILLGLSLPARASIDQAVGWMVLGDQGQGCTCVCIHRDGWCLSADHCSPPAEFTVKINGRTVTARMVYDPPGVGDENVDHVCLLKLEGGPFAWVEVAQQPSAAGTRVHSWGYPGGRKRYWTGSVVGVRQNGNVVAQDPAIGGHSGGPLFNPQNQVIGILWRTFPTQTEWLGLPEMRTAMSRMSERAADHQQQPDSSGPEAAQPIVWVLTSPGCVPCMNLKTDYSRGQFPGVRMNFVDEASTEGQRLKQRIQQTTGHYPSAWPTIWAEGAGTVTVGYTGFGSLRNWIVGALRLPITFWEGITGDRVEPPQNGLVPEPIDIPPMSQPELDWRDVTIIALGAEQDVGPIRGTGRAIAISRMGGTVERWFADLTDGRATLHLVFERVTPARYRAVCEAAGIDPSVGHVLVLVKQRAHALRAIARRKIVDLLQARAPEGLESLPVDVVPQLTSPDDYGLILTSLRTEEPEPAIDSRPPMEDHSDEPPAADVIEHTADPVADPPPASTPPADPPDEHQTTSRPAAKTEEGGDLDLQSLTWREGLLSFLLGPLLRVKQWMEAKAAALKGAIR